MQVYLPHTFELIEDKKHAYLREISKSVYGDPIPAIGMALVEEFPDEQERWKFGEAAKCDFQNSGLPLYTIVYPTQQINAKC